MTRRLSLRRETLAALTSDDLAVVHGAALGPQPTPPFYTPRTLNDCVALSVLDCVDLTYQPRCF